MDVLYPAALTLRSSTGIRYLLGSPGNQPGDRLAGDQTEPLYEIMRQWGSGLVFRIGFVIHVQGACHIALRQPGLNASLHCPLADCSFTISP